MNKKHLTTFFGFARSAILLITISMGYQLTALAGSSSKADNTTDTRTLIKLSGSERALVLEEMRAFLNSVQQITQGLAEDDMQIVIQAARHSGKAAQGQVPESLKKKLPMQFKKQGGDTHMKFDQLAMDADDLGDTEHTLKQLSTLMKNCVACHAVYRIETQD